MTPTFPHSHSGAFSSSLRASGLDAATTHGSRVEAPDPEFLRQLLRYDPETGKLFWRPRTELTFKSRAGLAAWNSKYAGKEAFSDDGNGYLTGKIGRKPLKAHRVAFAIAYGRWPVGQIDHINGDRSDNRLENLRDVAFKENCKNIGKTIRNTSGVVGITWSKKGQYWEAWITVDRKNIYLGCRRNKNDAIELRRHAEISYGFHKNHGQREAGSWDVKS